MKDAQVNVRMSAELLAAIKSRAIEHDRTVGGYIRRVIADSLGRPEALPDSTDGRATADNLPVRQIQLTRGQIALVDAEDYERVNQHKWNCLNFGAAQARIGSERVQMHRFILGLTKEDKRVVDHINHNKLDNRRCNLRIVTAQQNNLNRVPDRGRQYKGVFDGLQGKEPCISGKWARSHLPLKRYKAAITFNGQRFDLGGFPTPEEAARAYDAKAKELHGEFALLNFAETEAATA